MLRIKIPDERDRHIETTRVYQMVLDRLLCSQLEEVADRLRRTASDLTGEALNRLLQQERMGLIDLTRNHTQQKRPWCAGCQAPIRDPRSSAYFQRADGVLACSAGCVKAIDSQWQKIEPRH